jgi:hypothetical protein
MTQCAGTTLKGERCKREAREGSSYCSIHFEQPARAEPEPVSASDASASIRSPSDVDWMKAAIGLAILGAIVLFRFRR